MITYFVSYLDNYLNMFNANLYTINNNKKVWNNKKKKNLPLRNPKLTVYDTSLNCKSTGSLFGKLVKFKNLILSLSPVVDAADDVDAVAADAHVAPLLPTAVCGEFVCVAIVDTPLLLAVAVVLLKP